MKRSHHNFKHHKKMLTGTTRRLKKMTLRTTARLTFIAAASAKETIERRLRGSIVDSLDTLHRELRAETTGGVVDDPNSPPSIEVESMATLWIVIVLGGGCLLTTIVCCLLTNYRMWRLERRNRQLWEASKADKGRDCDRNGEETVNVITETKKKRAKKKNSSSIVLPIVILAMSQLRIAAAASTRNLFHNEDDRMVQDKEDSGVTKVEIGVFVTALLIFLVVSFCCEKRESEQRRRTDQRSISPPSVEIPQSNQPSTVPTTVEIPQAPSTMSATSIVGTPVATPVDELEC